MKKAKYIFITLSALLLIFMLVMSRRAAVSCDEVLHYNQSVAVFNFFATHGADTAALHTPVTHLKYYGQSYDNLTTILQKFFGIGDIYGFRHIMSTIAGWLTIMVTALFALWLTGYESAIIVLLLFAVSPTFLGHAQNNLKDIPFALGYISGIFFSCRLLYARRANPPWFVILLTISMAFCMSIRPGGMILICFLFFFYALFYATRYIIEGKVILREVLVKVCIISAVSVTAYSLSILLWPYALQDPIRNPFVSYNFMVYYPDTFRQIFEGKAEWSDFMPWYYLLKSMAITIPVIVSIGFAIGILLPLWIRRAEKRTFVIFLLITILLPVLFVIIKKSNLYSSWRHFLFIYPGIVLIAAVSFADIYNSIKRKWRRVIFIIAFVLLLLHPLFFILRNQPYAYLYYNQLAGGLKGAFGNYETDYYFLNQRESAEWLLDYLDRNKIKDSVIVGSNFSAEWYFRKTPSVRNIYFRNEERSMNDWDYYIATNRYISPFQLKNRKWPPADALKVIKADGVPIAAIIKRKSKADLMAYKALSANRNEEAAKYYGESLKNDVCDEVIFYNFAVALNRLGENEEADSALNQCLKLNPDFEPALMYLGNIEVARGNREKAVAYYKRLLGVNRKYDEAYEALTKIDK